MNTLFLQRFFSLMNSNSLYAILRHAEGLPEVNTSRDIDVLILHKDLSFIKHQLYKLALECNIFVLYETCDNQFYSIVLGTSHEELIQLDFQYNFAWMGIDLLDEREILKKRIFNGKVYHLPPDLTFLPKYLYSRILGTEYPKKYAAIQREAFAYNPQYLETVLRQISLGQDFSFWEHAGKWNLRIRAFLSALLHRPLRALLFMAEFLVCYPLNLFYRRGLMISFSGPDGCGKTTVIELLRTRLAVNTPILFHFRPTLFPNLGEAAQKAGVVKEVDRNFDQPQKKKKKGILNSLLRLTYYSADYIIGYFLKILPLRQRKHIIFFDRYFTDIIVDSERSSIFLNYKFLAGLRYFIPRCQYNFLFRVAPRTIRKRKQELNTDDINRIYQRLEYLAMQDSTYYWIDNNATPEEAVEQILVILLKNNNSK